MNLNLFGFVLLGTVMLLLYLLVSIFVFQWVLLLTLLLIDGVLITRFVKNYKKDNFC